jgi:hypothetical protein
VSVSDIVVESRVRLFVLSSIVWSGVEPCEACMAWCSSACIDYTCVNMGLETQILIPALLSPFEERWLRNKRFGSTLNYIDLVSFVKSHTISTLLVAVWRCEGSPVGPVGIITVSIRTSGSALSSYAIFEYSESISLCLRCVLASTSAGAYWLLPCQGLLALCSHLQYENFVWEMIFMQEQL